MQQLQLTYCTEYHPKISIKSWSVLIFIRRAIDRAEIIEHLDRTYSNWAQDVKNRYCNMDDDKSENLVKLRILVGTLYKARFR